MPMVRAMRLINSVEAGTTTGAQLETLLGDGGRLAEFNVVCGMRGQARRMCSAQTTRTAITASNLAKTALNNSAITREAAFNARTADRVFTRSMVSSGVSNYLSLFTWARGAMPATNSWQSVTFGNGIFVAVSSDGTGTSRVARSTDGISWTLHNMPTTDGWRSVTFGNGIFVAVAESSTSAATSTDGITWTLRTLPSSATWRSVAYGAGLFVAVNTSTSIATSPDGITWTSRNTGVANSCSLLIFGGGRFMGFSTAATSQAMTSTDGINWTSIGSPVSTASSATYFAPLGFLVCDESASTALSYSINNGSSWRQLPMPINAVYRGLTSSGDSIAVVGANNSVFTSKNGLQWQTVPSPEVGTSVKSTYGDGLFIFVESSNFRASF